MSPEKLPPRLSRAGEAAAAAEGGGRWSISPEDAQGQSSAAAAAGPRQLKRRRKQDEKMRVEAALALLDSAKARAAADFDEYRQFLRWKVKKQRAVRRDRVAEDADRQQAANERCRAILRAHRDQQAVERRRWAGYAGGVPTTAPPPPLCQPTLGDELYERFVREKRTKRLARSASPPGVKAAAGRDAAAQPPAPRSVPDAKPDAAAAAAAEKQPPAPPAEATAAGAAPHLADCICYEDFQQLLRGDLARRADKQASSQEIVERETARKRAARLRREEKVVAMQSFAGARRQVAAEKMLKDPPADCLLDYDILKYLPPDFIEELRSAVELNATSTYGATKLSQKTGKQLRDRSIAHPGSDSHQFFLTAVSPEGDESGQRALVPVYAGAARSPRFRRSLLRGPLGYWHWMERLPLPAPVPPPPLSPEGMRARQDNERGHLAQYLDDVTKGYAKTLNRTEHHGRRYSWARLQRHNLPQTKQYFDSPAAPVVKA
ncbi:hypothetical protein DIPPA_33097 [Diplonema papillatum]|nr:hypothetical protein DIPPA_33097 [Diplonema papillatum]